MNAHGILQIAILLCVYVVSPIEMHSIPVPPHPPSKDDLMLINFI